ncbi:SMI1/KNR4 family protein [Undibacterium sp. TC4M20W]|uniref:SMI1/KNR4 family protein n=1 Tax=Undibacterium sp. TC4M20W TaxID=3413052 RepID=UPI003BF0DDAC
MHELIQQFDTALVPQWERHPAPTSNSITHIESCLDFRIPPELIAFARLSASYGSFFLSLGEDYASDTHILEKNRFIRMNEHWLEQGPPAPEHLIFITDNFMTDSFWCLDISEKIRTYPVVLWSPAMTPKQKSRRYGNFCEFVSDQIKYYEKTK